MRRAAFGLWPAFQLRAPWRRVFATRTVRRRVQGVELVMPWSHRLPDYARVAPQYGQNLVELAVGLAADGPLAVIDVGANIGDSALQILDRVDARVLCVEGDPFWLDYLHQNVDREPRVRVQESLLTPRGTDARLEPVRVGGTTHFVAGAAERPALRVDELRDVHPDFASPRLIKSDTDGFETTLIPELAAEFASSRPVLFFELDTVLTREVSGTDAAAVWAPLEQLGYDHVAVWSNYGDPLGSMPISEAADATRRLADDNESRRQRTYWDVAVAHRDDQVGAGVIRSLNGEPFRVAGSTP
jgi:FkbM family methyltransferase